MNEFNNQIIEYVKALSDSNPNDNFNQRALYQYDNNQSEELKRYSRKLITTDLPYSDIELIKSSASDEIQLMLQYDDFSAIKYIAEVINKIKKENLDYLLIYKPVGDPYEEEYQPYSNSEYQKLLENELK